MPTRTFWSGKRRNSEPHRSADGSASQGRDHSRRRLPLGAPLSRLQSRSFPFGKLRVRTSPAGSDARKTAQIKTGAYSPPRFSAPALKASRNRENQAAHLLPANLFAEQRRVCKTKMEAKALYHQDALRARGWSMTKQQAV